MSWVVRRVRQVASDRLAVPGLPAGSVVEYLCDYAVGPAEMAAYPLTWRRVGNQHVFHELEDACAAALQFGGEVVKSSRSIPDHR